MKLFVWPGLAVLLLFLVLPGCQRQGERTSNTGPPSQQAPQEDGKAEGNEEADIQTARSELSLEDRRHAEAQDICPIMPNQRLGSMGKPFKLVIKDQPVFLCCKGCQRKALADPEKTLTKVEQRKARNKEVPAP